MKIKLLGLLLFSQCLFFACQKRADHVPTPKEKYQKEFADWLHNQKSSFSNEQLLVEKDKNALLNWGAANYFETEKTSFMEVPYAFQSIHLNQGTAIGTNSDPNNTTVFSLVFAKSKLNGVVEARILVKDKVDKLINGVSVKEAYFFDDLVGKRKRSYFRAAGNTRLTRMYQDDNQGNTQLQQIGSTGNVSNFCISIQIPVYDLKCNNNADPGSSFGYPTTCIYTLVGWANFNSGCAAWQNQSLEPPDSFDYDGFGSGFSGGGDESFVDNYPGKEPEFVFDPADEYEKQYPRFTEMVKSLKSFVRNNPRVLLALQKYTGFSKQKIIDHLTFGKGPTLKVEDMVDRYAFYNKSKGESTLHIRASYVRGLEQAFLQSTREATSFLLAITILHEYVHFGTHSNGIIEGEYEFGDFFERELFGVTVQDDNAGTILIKFIKIR